MDVHAETALQYAAFAADASGDSPCFEEWARGVALDREVLRWLDRLPVPKRQPNLVFAAARWHGVAAPGPYDGLRRALLGDDGRIQRTVEQRATQTNEVGRLATLVPALAVAAVSEPIALIEVGASAGLCLYPDRYRYRWSSPDGEVVTGSGPELTCAVTGPAPLPADLPRVAWRGGIDLNPLDVRDDDQMGWLATLVWPEDDARRARLIRAVDVTREHPPEIVQGDLVDELPALIDRAASYGQVVVFHSAVIAYLPVERREAFHDLMTALVAAGRCRWISNEAGRVLPKITGGPPMPAEVRGFVLGIDGHAAAWTHGHGRWLHWL